MTANEHKLYHVLEKINDGILLQHGSGIVSLHPRYDLGDIYSREELSNIIGKLSQEKIVKILKFPAEYPEEDEDLRYELSIQIDHFNQYFTDIRNKLGYKDKNEQRNTDAVLTITYTKSREIIINNLVLLAKPNFNSENDVVFQYLYNNPNRAHTMKQIETATGNEITKDLHKIVENLGFTGDYKKIFMSVTKTEIMFSNPITQSQLNDLGIPKVRLYKSKDIDT